MIDHSLRPTIKGTKDGEFGSRIPALWIGEGGFNHITCALNQLWNYNFNILDEKEKFNTGNWINVRVSQINGVYEYKVDGKVLHTAVNSNPHTWKNVKVIMGNRYGKASVKTALGEYRNFRVSSRPGKKNKFNYQRVKSGHTVERVIFQFSQILFLTLMN